MISKKINLYSVIKGYLNILLVFILYTLGYAAANYFLENAAALKSMTLSSEIKIFLAVGASLLFFILIYDKLSNQNENSISSFLTFKISMILLFPCAIAAGLLVGTNDIFINNQSVLTLSLNSSVAFTSASIVPIGITAFVTHYHTREWNVHYDLEQAISTIINYSIVAGIATLGCNFIVDILAKGQQLFSTILEFMSSNSSSALLAIALAPISLLASYCGFSKFQTHSRDSIESNKLTIDRSIEQTVEQTKSISTVATEQGVNYKNNDFLNPISQNSSASKAQETNRQASNSTYLDFLTIEAIVKGQERGKSLC